MLGTEVTEILRRYAEGTLEPLPLDTTLLIGPDDYFDWAIGQPTETDTYAYADRYCANAQNYVPAVKDVWDPGNANRPHIKHANLDPFDTLALICMSTRLIRCRGSVCRATRQQLKQALPHCAWTSFREYILVLAACTKNRGLHEYLRATIGHFRDFLRDTKEWAHVEWRQVPQADLYGALELIHWIEPMLQSRYRLEPDLIQNLHTRAGIFMQPIAQATESVCDINICQKRVWDLVQGHERRESSLPAIVHLARDFPPSFKDGHEDCTATHCHPSIENSTLAKQKHFCEDSKCGSIEFDLQELNNIDPKKHHRVLVWDCETRELSEDINVSDMGRRIPYMALSHVWSDGTGVGMKRPGTVNECLFNFFSDVALKLNCEAIWWDTLCLPYEREARGLAVGHMHENFRRAACTVVHDERLLDMEWKDDGSPCLALVMSTWFSRGWTVLELWASENVKVLFKDTIKDLEDDILVSSNNDLVHPAHRIASDVIRSVRRDFHPGKRHRNNLQSRELLPRLLSILQPRTTSWATDRMIIAGLLARLEGFDAAWTQARITREILTTFPVIHPSMLLHGQITMNAKGPWSWCPPSLLDMPLHHFSTFTKTIVVQDGGKVWGMWTSQPINQNIKDAIKPHGSHLSLRLRVQEALRSPQNCLLLRPADQRVAQGSTAVPFLLVTKGSLYRQEIWEVAASGRRCSTRDEFIAANALTMEERSKPKVKDNIILINTLDCAYIGAVLSTVSNEPSRNLYIRLGHDSTQPAVAAPPDVEPNLLPQIPKSLLDQPDPGVLTDKVSAEPTSAYALPRFMPVRQNAYPPLRALHPP